MKKRHDAPANRKAREPLYDTEIATPSHAERARTLAEDVGTATLCTVSQDPSGHPYGSFVAYSMDGPTPIFLVSKLAEHTRNMLQDERVSLLVAEPGTGDPLARGRVTLLGTCSELTGEAEASARESYLKKHPGSSYYIDFRDFSLWGLTVTSLRYIGGYGRMSWVQETDWNGADPDPIAPFATRIIDHMNDDHEQALRDMCIAFTKAKDFSSVVMNGIDRYGFEMSVKTEQGPRPIRLAFASEISDAMEARKQLVALTKKARA
ncbi:MAG: HugZ family protein [Myxococcota bacterium]